jgi:predicted O-methyltransferase YrrM
LEGRLLGRWSERECYDPVCVDEVASALSKLYGWDIAGFLHEPALLHLQSLVKRRLERVSEAIPAGFDGDALLGRLCYAVCRASAPGVVVETGVCRGVTSAHILGALAQNGTGTLISIDLPPLGAETHGEVGLAIPPDLRDRWVLKYGSSRQALPGVLAEYPRIDMFVHDSLHTFRTMSWEFQTVRPSLSAGGILLADDVDCNRAFRNWTRQPYVDSSFTVQAETKAGMFGFSRLLG